MVFSADDDALLRRLNRLRRRGEEGALRREAEAEAEARFGASRHLAVYGTLAPGEANDHVVRPVGGTWRRGYVRGERIDRAWHGYPTFRPDRASSSVAVWLLTAAALPQHAARLDAFEGPWYVRLLVPVLCAEGALLTVANLYADGTK